MSARNNAQMQCSAERLPETWGGWKKRPRRRPMTALPTKRANAHNSLRPLPHGEPSANRNKT